MEDAESQAAYESLLNTVESLQADLQQTITTCHGLREANGQLQRNYEQCKSELVRQRGKFGETRQMLIDASKAKIDTDRHTEFIVRKWKAQLDQRTGELEELQARLVPQDLDMLRIQVQEELELPHQSKVAELEGQLQAFQQMFFNVRRELERSKTEFDQYSQYHEAESRAAADRHAAEADSLRRRLGELEDALSLADDCGGARKLQGQLLEAATLNGALAQENEDLRADHAKLVDDHALALAAKSATIVDLDAQRAALAAEKAGGDKRLFADKQRCCALEQEALDLRRECDAAVRSADSDLRLAAEKGRASRREVAELTATLDVVRREKDDECADLVRSCAAAERRAAALDLELESAKRASLESRLLADSIVDSARADCRGLVAALEDRCLTLDLESTDRDRKHRSMQAAALDAERALQAELKIKDSQMARLAADKSHCSKALRAAEGDRDACNARLSDAERRVEALDDEKAALLRDQTDLRSQLDTNGDASRAAEAVQFELDQVTRNAELQRQAHISALADLKSAVKGERLSVAQAIRSETDSIRKKSDEALRKERKRSSAYKAKALSAHDRAARATEMLRNATAAQVDGGA
ncbi:hypothetical protein M885DRAFT_544020 [Pelagophyceae sp. CCMP2097]|nr:hypothetical protein M885DRAFT_544020 [Pelagophyceae sp. CCMP2097]